MPTTRTPTPWPCGTTRSTRSHACSTTYVSILAPQRIVVGGGVSRAGERLLGPLRARLRDLLVWQQEPEVVPAVLADEAGSLGAGLLARRALERTTPTDVPRQER